MTDYANVLTRRYKGKEWTLAGDDYNGLTWLSDGQPPTQAELDALWPEVQIEIAKEPEIKAAARQAVLDKLGLTQDEAQALLG